MTNEAKWRARGGSNVFFLYGGDDGQAGHHRAWRQLQRAVTAILPDRWFEVHELSSSEFGCGHDHYMLDRIGGPPVGSFHLWHDVEHVFVRSLPEQDDPSGSQAWESHHPTIADAVRAIGDAIDAQFRGWMLPALRPKADPHDGVLIELRPDLIRAHISRSCHDIMGYTPDEMLGHHPRGVIHPQDWPRIEPLLGLCREAGQTVRDIHRVRHGDGRYIWMQGHYTPYPDGGYAILLHDVTREWGLKQA